MRGVYMSGRKNRRKNISVDELRQLNEQAAAALDETVEMWKTATRTFPIKSPEYRAICGAGYHLQKLRMMLASEYEEATGDGSFLPREYVAFG